MQTAESSFLIKEDFAIYRENSKHFMSSHQLADFRKCPALWWKKHEGLIPSKTTEALAFGRAAHVLILEGQEAFDAECTVGGPINKTTGKEYGSDSKAYADWLKLQNKPYGLTTAEAKKLELMRASVIGHEHARHILSAGQPERVCRAPLAGIPCQVRLDWFNTNGIADLKTCDDLSDFEYDLKRYEYAHQMAFYCTVALRHMHSTFALPVHIIAVEKHEPYRTGVWKITHDVLLAAASENAAALARFNTCKANGYFPTEFEDLRFIAQ